jgi:hypothetical protein
MEMISIGREFSARLRRVQKWVSCKKGRPQEWKLLRQLRPNSRLYRIRWNRKLKHDRKLVINFVILLPG